MGKKSIKNKIMPTEHTEYTEAAAQYRAPSLHGPGFFLRSNSISKPGSLLSSLVPRLSFRVFLCVPWANN